MDKRLMAFSLGFLAAGFGLGLSLQAWFGIIGLLDESAKPAEPPAEIAAEVPAEPPGPGDVVLRTVLPLGEFDREYDGDVEAAYHDYRGGMSMRLWLEADAGTAWMPFFDDIPGSVVVQLEVPNDG